MLILPPRDRLVIAIIISTLAIAGINTLLLRTRSNILDVGWVERSATQHISGCWLWQSLHPTYNFFTTF
ncbi:MAG: hypothetical protein V7K67_11170 [Nostoc sp.]